MHVYHHCGQRFEFYDTGEMGVPALGIDGKVVEECPTCKKQDIQAAFLKGGKGFHTEFELTQLRKNPFWQFICEDLEIID